MLDILVLMRPAELAAAKFDKRWQRRGIFLHQGEASIPFVAVEVGLRQGMLVFDGDPLESVIAEISRHTPVEIVMADPSLRSLKIGGFFRTGDTQFLLDTLSSGFGIEAEHIRPGLIYLRPMPR